MKTSPFDRLAGVRQNRRLRNIWTGLATASLFFGLILILEPIVSETATPWAAVVVLGILFVISLSFAIYFHLKWLTRE